MEIKIHVSIAALAPVTADQIRQIDQIQPPPLVTNTARAKAPPAPPRYPRAGWGPGRAVQKTGTTWGGRAPGICKSSVSCRRGHDSVAQRTTLGLAVTEERQASSVIYPTTDGISTSLSTSAFVALIPPHPMA